MGKQTERADQFIRISGKTKRALDALKEGRETYDDIIRTLLGVK